MQRGQCLIHNDTLKTFDFSLSNEMRALCLNLLKTTWIPVKCSVHCLQCELNIADALLASFGITEYFTLIPVSKNKNKIFFQLILESEYYYFWKLKTACKQCVQQLKGCHCESGFSIFARRVLSIYSYSPFKSTYWLTFVFIMQPQCQY